MTAAGWLFMLTSVAFVWGLTGWCFWKVLAVGRAPRARPEDPPRRHPA